MNTDQVTVGDISGTEEMAACVALYQDVMGLRAADGSLNPRLLTALQANSGIVVGAYQQQDLVGFAYSFLARQGRTGGHRLYQYSQLAVVARGRQGAGLGRRLKFAQRDRCLADGITLMRWAFDPMKTRNAHFNLDVLGARLEALKPAMYGEQGFGDDTGESTDRFIVDWHLAGPARTPAPAIEPQPDWQPGVVEHDAGRLLVVVPADWQQYRTRTGSPAARLREKLRHIFEGALVERVGVSCRRIDEQLAAYLFVPRQEE